MSIEKSTYSQLRKSEQVKTSPYKSRDFQIRTYRTYRTGKKEQYKRDKTKMEEQKIHTCTI
jgi:hypothetical protein